MIQPSLLKLSPPMQSPSTHELLFINTALVRGVEVPINTKTSLNGYQGDFISLKPITSSHSHAETKWIRFPHSLLQ